ncbi:MAG: hypothetical protein OEX08_00180 [Candidatus Nomurabacteria bacterium]|nr:hypothetical protein [Candidatus Nomurabacteria bacterium]
MSKILVLGEDRGGLCKQIEKYSERNVTLKAGIEEENLKDLLGYDFIFVDSYVRFSNDPWKDSVKSTTAHVEKTMQKIYDILSPVKYIPGFVFVEAGPTKNTIKKGFHRYLKKNWSIPDLEKILNIKPVKNKSEYPDDIPLPDLSLKNSNPRSPDLDWNEPGY